MVAAVGLQEKKLKILPARGLQALWCHSVSQVRCYEQLVYSSQAENRCKQVQEVLLQRQRKQRVRSGVPHYLSIMMIYFCSEMFNWEDEKKQEHTTKKKLKHTHARTHLQRTYVDSYVDYDNHRSHHIAPNNRFNIDAVLKKPPIMHLCKIQLASLIFFSVYRLKKTRKIDTQNSSSPPQPYSHSHPPPLPTWFTLRASSQTLRCRLATRCRGGAATGCT